MIIILNIRNEISKIKDLLIFFYPKLKINTHLSIEQGNKSISNMIAKNSNIENLIKVFDLEVKNNHIENQVVTNKSKKK